MVSNSARRRTICLVVLVALGLAVAPTVGAHAVTSVQEDCNPETQELALEGAFTESHHAAPGVTPFAESSNETSYDLEAGTATVDVSVDSGTELGGGGVLEIGRVTFDRSWTAPCTGVFTFTAVYNVSVAVEQNREAGTFGNGVTKAEVNTNVFVGNTTENVTWVTVDEANRTEFASMIPTLEDLPLDAVINVFSASVSEKLGLPIGEFLLKEVGVERDSTAIDNQTRRTSETISVTFEAQEGATYTFLQQTDAAIIAVSIGAGGATGDLSVETDLNGAWVTPGTEPPEHLGGSEDGGTDGLSVRDRSMFVVDSTTDGPDFDYEFTVDGQVEPSETADVAADDSDEITENSDGTVTVEGSTGSEAGDAFLVTGELLDFSTTADESEFALELNGEDVTEEVTALDASETTADDGNSAGTLEADLSTLVVDSTTDGPDFVYQFVVDGEVEPTSTSDVSADSSDHIVDNGDGTFTVQGSTGSNAGDAFHVDGEISQFSTNANPSEFALLLDGEDVTDELASDEDGG